MKFSKSDLKKILVESRNYNPPIVSVCPYLCPHHNWGCIDHPRCYNCKYGVNMKKYGNIFYHIIEMLNNIKNADKSFFKELKELSRCLNEKD